MTTFVLRHRKLILGGYLLMILFFASVIAYRVLTDRSVIDNSVAIWFMQDDPELKRYEQYQQAFGEQEWTLLMLGAESIYDPQFLQDLDQITQRIEQLPAVRKVNSITNIRDNVLTTDDALLYERLYTASEDTPLTAVSIDQFRKQLQANPIFEKNLLQRADNTHAVLLIQNDNRLHEIAPYRIAMVDSIRAIVGEYASVHDRALAGTSVVNAELNRSSKRDMLIFYTLISVLLIIIGWLTLRSWKNILVMLVVVVGSIVPTMGLIALLHIPYNMVTVMMPTILIALSVADIIHVIVHFHQERQHSPSEQAIAYTLRHLWRPGLWTTLTTVVGFSSLLLSTVFPIFQLGLFASFGIALALLITWMVAPGVLVSLFPQQDEVRLFSSTQSNGLANFIFRYKYVSLVVLGILSLSLTGLPRLNVDTNYTKFFGGKTDLSRAYDQIKQAGFAQNPITVTFTFPEGTDYNTTDQFAQIAALEDSLKNLPEVIKVLSPKDLLFQINEAFLETESNYADFTAYGEAQLGQLFLLGEMSGNDDLYDLVLYDKSQYQLQLLTNYLSSKELSTLRAEVRTLKQQYLRDDIKMAFTGTTVLWANMDEQVSQTQFTSLLGVTMFLLVFFPLIFRSLSLGLIGIFVNAFPLAVTYGCMGWLDVDINMATALIGGIALGIVTDDTIHLINSFRRGIEQGLPKQVAIRQAISYTGKSVIMTSVILGGAFLSLTTSDFLPTANFGILVTVCVTIALFVDLFVLPLLLMLLPEKNAQKAEVATRLSAKQPSF